MTVFKDVRLVSPIAVDIAEKFIKGKKVNGLENYSLKELTLDDTLYQVNKFFKSEPPATNDNITNFSI